MVSIKNVLDRSRPLAVAGTLLLGIGLTAIPWQATHAEVLTKRSLQVTSSVPSDESASVTPGHPQNGNAVGHTYKFTVEEDSSVNTIESITFEAWDSAFGYLPLGTPSGTAPTGFDASGVDTETVTVSNLTTPGSDDFTASSATDNTWTLSGGSLAADPGDEIQIVFPNVFVNPTSLYVDDASGDKTYFVHIRTYTAGPTLLDVGTVTNAVVPSIDITTRVQETLRFSVEGAAVTEDAASGNTAPTAIAAATSVGPACDPLGPTTSILIGDTNNALSSAKAYHGASYFRLATNSSNGSIVYYSGETLKSGSTLSIPAVGGTAVAGAFGTEQFGLAIDNTAVGIAGGHNLSSLVPLAPYGALGSNNYAFTPYGVGVGETTSPVQLAQSTGVVDCETGAVRYVANIDDDTPAGIYTTRINYIASPAY